MMRALLTVRLRGMLAAFTAQTRQRKKKSKGMAALFIVLYVYVAVVLAGSMCMFFGQLVQPYHRMGLDWLYFAMAGLMGLCFSILGGVFMTQNQLYDARDNDLLLSMPIPPRAILLSRMVPLLGLDLLFCAIVMIPAFVMYVISAGFPGIGLPVGIIGICLLSQAVCCLLGWGLHWLLSRMNRSLASMLYLMLFLGVYFAVYSKAGTILNAVAGGGAAIGAAMKSWVWPLYALGMGCLGKPQYMAAFLGLSAVCFGIVYWFLSKTFLHAATYRRSGKKRRLDMKGITTGSAAQAIVFKEWRHFLGSPVYLTNEGLGVVMTAALAVAGVIFRGRLIPVMEELAGQGLDVPGLLPLAICVMLGLLASMMFISAPSVSLEGKNLWVLKSMPVAPERILKAKLRFHVFMCTPVTVVSGLVLALCYGCDGPGMALCALVPGLLTVFSGVLGMVFGLKWAKLDWLSEAYPCKQGMAVTMTMFSMMGLALLLGGGFLPLQTFVSADIYLTFAALVLAAGCWGLSRVLLRWGVGEWENL